MELEQRVKALEQEVAILKHQIQVTLLEIHEQVLAGRHPALRADGATNAASAASAPAPVYADASSPAEDDEVREPQNGNNTASAPQPQVTDTPPPAPPPEPVDEADEDDYLPATAMPVLAPARADWSEVVSTINWLQESIEQVGIAHTRREIALYVRDGVLPPEVEVPLLDLLDLYEAQDTYQADRDHHSSVTQVLAELINSRRAREDEHPTEEPEDTLRMLIPSADVPEVTVAEDDGERQQMRKIVQRLIYGLENLDAA